MREREYAFSNLYLFTVFTGRKFPLGIKPQGKEVQKKNCNNLFQWDLKIMSCICKQIIDNVYTRFSYICYT